MSRKFIITIAIVAIALIGVTLAYKAWQNQQSAEQSGQNQVGTKDETANWKIYQNEKYGFSLKYPNGWSLKEYYNEEDSFVQVKLKSPDFREIEIEIGGTEVVKGSEIAVEIGKRNGRNLEQIYKPNGSLIADLIEDGSVKPEKITINGKEGVEFELRYEDPGYREVNFLLNQEEYVSSYIFAGTAGNAMNHRDYPIFKKILESIQPD